MRVDLALIAGMIAPGSRVLDIGCGDGALIDHLFQTKGCDARGIEIDMARGDPRGRARPAGDARRRGPRPGALSRTRAFDYVVLSRTLQAVEHPREVLRADAAHRHARDRQFPEFRPLAGALAIAVDRADADDPDLVPALVRVTEYPSVHHPGFFRAERAGMLRGRGLARGRRTRRRGPWRRFPWMANLFGSRACSCCGVRDRGIDRRPFTAGQAGSEGLGGDVPPALLSCPERST